MTEKNNNSKWIVSILLTTIMVFIIAVTLLISRSFPNSFGLGKVIVIHVITMIGFIFSFFIGRKSSRPYRQFSIISNFVLFLSLCVVTFLLAVANGISEP